MIADVVTIFGSAALVGLGIIVIEGESKLRGARHLVAPGTSHFGTTNEGPELELPTYEPGVPVEHYPAGVETDVRQALAIAADEIDPAAVERIRTAVMDEVGRRREHKAGAR